MALKGETQPLNTQTKHKAHVQRNKAGYGIVQVLQLERCQRSMPLPPFNYRCVVGKTTKTLHAGGGKAENNQQDGLVAPHTASSPEALTSGIRAS